VTSHRPRVKICGLTRLEDVALAVELGADALGFICWPGSPRYVAPDTIRRMTEAVAPFVTRVGVFVNASVAHVEQILSAAGLDVAQLHGEEHVADYVRIGRRLLKLVHVDDDAGMAAAKALPADVTPIVDAVDQIRRGGTGTRADWSRAAVLARERRIVLAGGLTSENVAAAVRRVHPWAVDVSSGVEHQPGIKSATRLRAFFEALDELRSEEA